MKEIKINEMQINRRKSNNLQGKLLAQNSLTEKIKLSKKM